MFCQCCFTSCAVSSVGLCNKHLHSFPKIIFLFLPSLRTLIQIKVDEKDHVSGAVILHSSVKLLITSSSLCMKITQQFWSLSNKKLLKLRLRYIKPPEVPSLPIHTREAKQHTPEHLMCLLLGGISQSWWNSTAAELPLFCAFPFIFPLLCSASSSCSFNCSRANWRQLRKDAFPTQNPSFLQRENSIGNTDHNSVLFQEPKSKIFGKKLFKHC